MVGLGETDDEITEVLRLLKDAGVDLVTIGQYLAPSPKHLAVDRFPNQKDMKNGVDKSRKWDS